jgi:hypothetical protein
MCSACTRELIVVAGVSSQGTARDIQCKLKGWKDGSPYLLIAANTPCETKASVWVHVFQGRTRLSSEHNKVRLYPKQPNEELNYLVSGPFKDLPKGTPLRIEVWTECESGEDVYGRSPCQMP